MRVLLLASLLVFQGVLGGQYCRQYYTWSSSLYRVYYCSGRCCGSLYGDDCCSTGSSSNNNNNYNYNYNGSACIRSGTASAVLVAALVASTLFS